MRIRLLSIVLYGMTWLILSGFVLMARGQPVPVLEPGEVSAAMMNAEGQNIGYVTFTTYDNYVLITAELNSLPAGFLGFHIHEAGSCEHTAEGTFMAAGGHFNPIGRSHPEHAGDLPSLFVLEDGTAYLSIFTDRFTIDELLDEGGSAVIVHANPDNFSNIPERYGDPDEETLNTGDSGERLACGVISQQDE